MPELPDVEVFRRQAATSSLHRPVERVRAPDAEVLDGIGDRALTRALRGSCLEGAHRHGKHLFVEMPGGDVLGISFSPTARLHTGPVDDEHHLRLVVAFADGGTLSLVDHDRASLVSQAASVEEYVAEHRLGPDALTLSADALRELVRASPDELKTILTDQERIAGLGDAYADEILFQARTDPRTLGRVHDDRACVKLHRTLRRVLDTAVRREADPSRMPRTWLLPHRQHGAPCPRGNGRVHQARTPGGGVGYWCPECQSG